MLWNTPLQRRDVGGIDIAFRQAGDGPPLLLLHGHPQTHVMWHKVWPALVARFTLVAPDLRGYGDSAKPEATPDHTTCSKRVMAADQVALMQALGFTRFAVLAHDRGARVAHRLALDHRERVTRMLLLDIAPTLAMYRGTTEAFARAYFHWFSLIQPAPLPERMIEADAESYVRGIMGGRFAGLKPFDPRALAEYVRCAKLPGWAHGICEDYRASATIDLEHDEADIASGRRVTCPLRVLWGAHGVVGKCFDVLAEWRRVAAEVSGRALDCGHYLAEERPDLVIDETLSFMGEHTS